MKSLKTYPLTMLFSTVCLIFFGPLNSGAQIKTASGQKLAFRVIDSVVRQQMDSLKIPGASIAVISKGKIVYENTYGLANIDSAKKVEKSTVFEAASLSKPVFAYFTLKLLQDGKIVMDLDTPVYRYLPYPDIAYDDRYKLITARMLLSHRSGFPNWRDKKLTISFSPGTQYQYSGEGYEYLGRIVSERSGADYRKNLDSLFQQEVCKPLGLAHMGYTRTAYLTQHKAYGYYTGQNPDSAKFKPVSQWLHPAWGLTTDADSYARFLIALMKNKGLKKRNVDSLLKPRVKIPDNGKYTGQNYAYGFAVDTTKYGVRYQHTGNNGNYTGGFMFFRDKELGYVVLTNGDQGILLDLKLADWFTYGDRKKANKVR